MSALFDAVEDHADRTFLIDAQTNRTFSYGDILDLVDDLGDAYVQAGVRPGERIALLLRNSVEMVVAELASLRIGATAIPINPSVSPSDIAFILASGRPALTVFEAKTQALLPIDGTDAAKRRQFLIATDAAATSEASVEANAATPAWRLVRSTGARKPRRANVAARPASDIATIHYTSGTTGRPKGVAHRLDGLVASARAFNALVGIDEGSRMLHVMPMAYMAGFLNTLLSPWVAGGSVVLAPAFDARSAFAFWEPVIAHRVTALWVSPTMLASLLHLDRDPRGAAYCREHIKTLSVGTAPLPRVVQDRFEERYGCAALESYGLSETLFVTSNTASRPSDAKDGSVGPLLEGVRCRMVDESGNVLPSSGEGEIELQTEFMFAGYVDPDTGEIDRVAPDSWFKTGDLGKLGSDGQLRITGRKKDLIIRGGINVSPRAVEDVIAASPHVLRVAVIGLPHDVLGEEVVAAVVLDKAGTLKDVRLKIVEQVKSRLSPAQLPTRWFELAELPVTSTGKVQKGEVRRMVSEMAKAADISKGARPL